MENLIWHYRRKFKIDGQDFAREIGITPQKLSRIEREQERPSETTKDSCARILGVPKEILFSDSDEEYRKIQGRKKEIYLDLIEKNLEATIFCDRNLTSVEISRWLFWADEVLESIMRQKILLDAEIEIWLCNKIIEKIKDEEEKIKKKKEMILNE